MESFSDFASAVDSFIWSPYLLTPALIDTGITLTIRLGTTHLVKLGPVLRFGLIDRNDEDVEGDITNYQALATVLAATVGVGNTVGVATVIGPGGLGALFWMWVTGPPGMASERSEAFLGVKYRQVDAAGEQSDGPQYYLHKAIPSGFGKTLGILFAVSAVLVAFGIGNLTQGSAAASNLENSFDIEPTLSGMVMFILVGAALMGGIKPIGRITAGFMPVMVVFYIGAVVWMLAANVSALPETFKLIFTDAFTGTAVVSGFAGPTLILVLRMGVVCGLFPNKSGLGSGAIVAAAASITHPVRQGLVSMTQVFIDTVIVVSFTDLVITSTGVWQDGNVDTGAPTAEAFSRSLPGHWGGTIVTLSAVLFAFSTILGWFCYGERAFESLVGCRGTGLCRAVFTYVVFIGAVTYLETVWSVASAPNSLMTLPNLIDLVVPSGLVARETKTHLRFDSQLYATAAEIDKWQAQQDFEASSKN